MLIKLEYNPSTKNVETIDGVFIGCSTSDDLTKYEIKESDSSVPVDEVVKLKEAGFTAEEIIEMHKKGVL